MPLLSYFVVVGSALIGLLYLANAVLPDDPPIHISSNIEPVSAARQSQQPAAVPMPTPEPKASFAAAPVGSPPPVQERQQIPVAQDTPPPKKRKPVARKREWSDDFAQTNRWSRDDRPWTDQRRGSGGWRSQGWRDPFWGANWRGPGWR